MNPKNFFISVITTLVVLWAAPSRADVVVAGDPSAAPLREVLPALRVQTPNEMQRQAERALPDSPEARTLWIKTILDQHPQTRAVVWVAPEDAPYQGEGPYTLTVGRRLAGGQGVEQIRVDAETGTPGARIAALRVAELVKTAPEAADPPDAAESSQPRQPASEPEQRTLGVTGGTGAALRLEPEQWLAQPGVDVAALLGAPLLPLGDVQIGAAFSYFPSLQHRVSATTLQLGGFDVQARARWLTGSKLLLGVQAGVGIRTLELRAARGGARGDLTRAAPLLSSHVATGWRGATGFGTWQLLGELGADFTLREGTFRADGAEVFSLSVWAPSAHLRLEASF